MKTVGIGIAALLLFGAAAFAQPGPTQEELNAAQTNVRDWLYATHDYSGQRYVATDQINSGNAADLGPLCLYQMAEVDTFQTNSIVYDGILYVSTPKTVAAIDATNCAEQWRRQAEVRREGGIQAQRGLALKDGILVRGTPDGYLVALDAARGELLWKASVVRPDSGDSINVAPLIMKTW